MLSWAGCEDTRALLEVLGGVIRDAVPASQWARPALRRALEASLGGVD